MVGSTMQQEVEAIPGGKGAERYTAWQVVLCLLYIVHRTSYLPPSTPPSYVPQPPTNRSQGSCSTLLCVAQVNV